MGDEVYVGVDGGATSTKVVIGDENSILGEASTGPANPNYVGMEKALDHLIEGLENALQSGKKEKDNVERMCIGMAGVSSEERKSMIEKRILDGFPNISSLQIMGDTPVAWYGAFTGEPGIVVIGGTGYIVYGRDAKGENHLEGELQVGDGKEHPFLGGRSLGYHTACKIKELLGSKEQSLLTQLWSTKIDRGNLFPQFTGLGYDGIASFVVASAYQPDEESSVQDREVAQIAPLLVEALHYGDKHAEEIITKASEVASTHIKKVAERLNLGEKVNVSYAGSLISDPFVSPYLSRALEERNLTLSPPKMSPRDAALEIARRDVTL